MDIKTKELQDLRNKLNKDFCNNILPERLPVSFSMSRRLAAQYAGLDVIDVQYRFDTLDDAAEDICRRLFSDTCPIGGVSIISRPPSYYQLLDSQSFVMGTNGFVQHPEVVGMLENEYAELINDPFAFLLEKVLPRQYKNLTAASPAAMLINYERARSSLADEGARAIALPMKLTEMFGYTNNMPMGASGFSEAPYDFIADQLRSFSGVSADIRRHRGELYDACEAVLPLLFYWSLPTNPDPMGSVMTPLHMPTFMREKDFAEVWLPSYMKMFRMYAALGVRGCAFCEDDWMRYVDYLSELPAGFRYMFEYGDAKTLKDKLGKKYILQGLYPIDLVKRGTKQQCIDKAKELLDIMMPGGGYAFGFDKGPLSLEDINFENYCALAEFIRDYAHYDNAGESFGAKVNEEGFVFDEKEIPKPRSRYFLDWDEYKRKYPSTPDYMRDKYAAYDKNMLSAVMFMLI